MSSILVAIICNLVAGLILVAGVLTSIKSGWKIALTKLVLTLVSAAGAFFLTPFLSDTIWAVSGVSTLALELGISQITINSCIFLLVFLFLFGFDCIISSLIKHALIKKMQKSASENRAKIKRAKSINPKAEKAARKTIWRELKADYEATNKWWKKILSVLMGLVVHVAVGFVLLLPMNYVAKDLNTANDNKYAYLEQGYEYTLNGVVGDNVLDFIVGAQVDEVEEEQPGVEEEQPSEEEAPEVGA